MLQTLIILIYLSLTCHIRRMKLYVIACIECTCLLICICCIYKYRRLELYIQKRFRIFGHKISRIRTKMRNRYPISIKHFYFKNATLCNDGIYTRRLFVTSLYFVTNELIESLSRGTTSGE
jgi:hypothetical protein